MIASTFEEWRETPYARQLFWDYVEVGFHPLDALEAVKGQWAIMEEWQVKQQPPTRRNPDAKPAPPRVKRRKVARK